VTKIKPAKALTKEQKDHLGVKREGETVMLNQMNQMNQQMNEVNKVNQTNQVNEVNQMSKEMENVNIEVGKKEERVKK
jgi:hypothetical protein